MVKEYSEGPIRKIFRNEFTWIITIVMAVTGFYKMVVIPINNLQIQLTEIQTKLSHYDTLESRVAIISDKVNETSTKLDEHLKMEK